MVGLGAGRSGKGVSFPISRRRFLGISLAFAAGLSTALLTGCGSERQTGDASSSGDEPGDSTKGVKTLVVYYSAQGHTRRVAQTIAKAIGADIFEITPMRPYTTEDLDWMNGSSRVNVEHDDVRLRHVELEKRKAEGWEEYDRVFLGYPIWWGIAAWPASSFAEENDFTGKTVVPFCTSLDSGIGSSDSLLAKGAATGDWLEGQRFSSGASDAEAVEWAHRL